MRTCIYCAREKEDSEFSKEHIIPRALIGSLDNNPFITYNVCQKCNNLSGTFIDASFIKNWYVNNSRAAHMSRYCDPNEKFVLPLRYMGQLKGMSYQNKICDNWMGPTGDMIYHFHEPYPQDDNIQSMVGLPSTAWKKNIDKGFVFLFVRATNPIWHKTILKSVSAKFKKTPIYIGNGDTPNIEFYSDIPHNLIELHKQLLNFGKIHQVSFPMSISYYNRFLCKLALGLGSLHLKSEFLSSENASMFRQYMWEKDNEQRKKIKLHGTAPPLKKNGLDDMMQWNDGHCIALTNTSGIIGLYTNFYGGDGASLQLAGTTRYWKEDINDGIVYIITPVLGKVIGPISFTKYILYRNLEPEDRDRHLIPELKLLQAELDKKKSPPFDIPPLV